MPPIDWTTVQRRAVEATGKSVIVSAAAGAGKTAVLAERCVYFVCDAPPGERCTVDELLVLTFTDAAAAEMRSRIVAGLRERLRARPDNTRLREQVALAEAAQISTIHSFCLWILRRWFGEAGIDPLATILDGDEAGLLKRDVLDSLFTELYAIIRQPGDPLVHHNASICGSGTSRMGGMGKRQLTRAVRGNTGKQVCPCHSAHKTTCDHTLAPVTDGEPPDKSPAPEPKAPPATMVGGDRPTDGQLARAFSRLVDDYGLGDDRGIAAVVLKLFEFVTSLPDPDAWLREAVESLADRPQHVVLAWFEELQAELSRQAEHCDQTAASIEAGHEIGAWYATQIRAYADQLRIWAALDSPLHLDGGTSTVVAQEGNDPTGVSSGKAGPAANSGGAATDALDRYETLRREIAAFEFSRKRAPKVSADDHPTVTAARDAAAKLLKDVKERLFSERLKKRFALFSVDEWLQGLSKIAPYVSTITDLVRRFRAAYTARKRQLDTLDFQDLERFAFELLRARDNPQGPSEVARTLHRRFAYVLVDEFQDVNPLQQAIIRLVSRELAPGLANNLFVVGDVKQSIYRFRLAEPEVFIERLRAFCDRSWPGEAIALQDNFRSRPEILEAVNLVFRQLMRAGGGDVVYDGMAELRAGRETEPKGAPKPVELHVLERTWPTNDDNDGETVERGTGSHGDPGRWTPIEREAYLIGSRIREWTESGGAEVTGRPLAYRDVAILLRAAKVNAERMAGMLQALGIPAYADVGGSLFGALEIRDVLAALQVLDNVKQDIPLTAVLRSGIMGEQLTEDDLVEIRCADRDRPFHEAVRRYAKEGGDEAVRHRLRTILGRVDRYRHEARRCPLADTLWRLYVEQGYLAYAGGLPNGAQRRANLLKLHELARKFGTFRKQGLLRFLRFVQSLETEGSAIATAPALGEADDVVRIMSIHQSKGLEFPVVFVAGLGTRFNLADRSGRIIFERKAKVGLRVVDIQEMIEYPSAAHLRVTAEIERRTREEELRLLYVAMTRAREKLVLVGSRRNVQAVPGADHPTAGNRRSEPSLLTITTAETPLDWLLPVLAPAPGGRAPEPGGIPHAGAAIDVHLYNAAEMARWSTERHFDPLGDASRRAVAECAPLPSGEPFADRDREGEEVRARLDYQYPWLAPGTTKAVVAASEFKGTYDSSPPVDQRPDRPREPDEFQVRAPVSGDRPADQAARRGTVVHRVLQHLSFSVATDSIGVASELQRMVREGLITRQEHALVESSALEWFVETPLAKAIRQAGDAYRREFQYLATESPAQFDQSVGPAADEDILVRGIVDGVLPTADAIEIIDFKTDIVRSGRLVERSERYRPQMELYARAMTRIWRRPVQRCWLVFLAAREIVELQSVGQD